MGFNQPVDIANRALQHCGASLITTLADNDKGAAAISQCYDGLRKAELRRNVWRFSVRRAMLYPINTAISGLPFGSATTGAYPNWAANVTYAVGTVVLATDGLLYEALSTSLNLNPAGGANAATWVLLGSPQLNNAAKLPTLLLLPPLWSAIAVYAFGAIVKDSKGKLWVSQSNFNAGNEPGNIVTTKFWDTYFGSMCVQPFNQQISVVNGVAVNGNAYWCGDLVYVPNPNGSAQVFVSLENSNSNNPTAPSVWNSTQTYEGADVVQDAAGFFWQSTMDLNTNNMPGVYGFWSSVPTYTIGAFVIGSDNGLYQALLSTTNVNPANGAHPSDWLFVGYPGSWPVWNSTSTYAQNAIVAGSDGFLYQSLQASNVGNQPVGAVYNPNTPSSNWWMGLRQRNPWTAYFKTSTANGSWLNLDAGTKPLDINYPIGTGPAMQEQTRNVFMLPNGYLRMAPQDPKAGSVSFLGAPTGLMYNDWVFDGNYIISRSPYPIMVRFAADITLVNTMDDMFCEGLGARIGEEVCESLTQSGSKIAIIAAAYKTFMNEARTVNGIEEGAEEPPEDDYITCRI